MIRGRRVANGEEVITNSIKALLFYLLISSLLLLIPSRVSAQYGQYGQYGAPVPSQSILIEKMVAKPGTSNFVDNLSPTDPRFAPGQQITFRLAVKNTSDTNLTNVTVKDFVPSFLSPLSGPGNFDSNTQTVSFGAGNFGPSEQKVFTLTMQIASQDKLPVDKGLFCEINKAQASTDKVFDEDTAQFCIEKQVLGAQNVPSTGPEFGLVLIGAELGLLGIGLGLKRRFAR